MLKIHPRGFYGSDRTVLMHNVSPPKNFTTRPLEMPVVEEFSANKVIDDIFHEYVSGRVKLSDFDTVTRILSNIVKAFGYKDLQYWHAQQFNSPYFGSLHVDFIEDWAKYICTGSRNLDIYTWGVMLDRSSDKANPNAELGEYTRRLFNKKTVHPFNPDNLKIINVFGEMLKYPDGLDNIIITAYILFCVKR